jgi:hypothetical protein
MVSQEATILLSEQSRQALSESGGKPPHSKARLRRAPLSHDKSP